MQLKRRPIVLLIAAYDKDELLRAAPNVGVSDVLSKPVAPSTLFNAIMRLFAVATLEDGKSSTTDEVEIVEANTLSGFKALLVEDNDLNQEVAAGLIKELGLLVDVAENGAIAIEMARTGDYDVVLMDVQMPVMDGVAATIELLKDPNFKDLPILAMTASVMSQDRKRCLAAGMNDHIAKPIEPDALRSALLKWLPARFDTQGKTATRGQSASGQENRPFLPEQIEGLDVEAGLRRALGKKLLYVSLLRKFVADQRSSPKNIGRAIETGRMDLAERLAHTLKGVAGTIGAADIQVASAKLEQSIKEKRPAEELQQYVTEVEMLLDSLIERLELILPALAPVSPPTTDPGNLVMVCDRLVKLLAENDPEALDVLQEHSALLQVTFPEHYTTLEQRVQSFDFEAALKALAEARAPRQV